MASTDPPIIGTPDQVADVFFSVIEGAMVVIVTELERKTVLPREDPTRFQSIGLALECAIFAWWSLDVILWAELHQDDVALIRPRLVDRLVAMLHRAGWPEQRRADLELLWRRRFAEYGTIMHEAGQDAQGGLVRVIEQAWRSIAGPDVEDDPSAFVVLLGAAATTNARFRGVGQRVVMLPE